MRLINELKDLELGGWLFLLGALTVVSFAVTCAICSIRADGISDFCYVETEMSTYRVREHVPWRDDRTIGIFTDPNEAQEFKGAACQ